MDISARVVVGLLGTIEGAGYDVAPALVGMPFTREELSQWSRRVRWDDYVELFERLGAITGRDGMFRAMEGYQDQFPELRALAGAVISPAQYARLHCLVVASSWAAVRTRYEVTDERVVMEGELPKSLRGSELFFEISGFVTRTIPTFLGYPPAEVETSFTSHSFRAVVPLPPSRAIPSRVRRAVVDGSGDAVRLLAAILGDLPLALDAMFAGRAPPPPTGRGATAAARWGLTAREAEALAQVVQGRSNKDIAAALGCSVRTAEAHVAKVLAKAGCGSRAEVSARYWSLDE